jgi:hypothetical protein
LSEALGGAFQSLLESVSGLFGSISQNLTDANGQINPAAGKDLGKAIGEFAGETLAQLIKMLSEAVGLLTALGGGIGIVAGKVVHGSLEGAEQRSDAATDVNKEFERARLAGDKEKMKELAPQLRAIARGKSLAFVQDAETAAAAERGESNQRVMASSPALRRGGADSLKRPSDAMSQKPKPQEVKTQVDVKVSGTVQQGIDVTASSSSPNTKVTDQTKQSMGFRPL